MNRRGYVAALLLVAFFYCPNPVSRESLCGTTGKFISSTQNAIRDESALLWRQPEDISSLDMLNGKGGKVNCPKGPFTFLKEKMSGTSPKFVVRDSSGSKWKVKLGPEARPETAATRLVWAVGYFTDEDYFLPEITVHGMKKLKRGQEFVSKDGTVHGAMLERYERGRKAVGKWNWRNNPFSNTRELRGLVVMMSLINNWDIKTSNNTISRVGKEHRYLVSDLGASIGSAGFWSHSKGDLQAYRRSKFVKKISAERVDLRLATIPPLRYLWVLPVYLKRTEFANLAEDLPESDVEWIGHLLSQLSSRQIADAFRAGGFSSDEVEGYTDEVRKRIEELCRL